MTMDYLKIMYQIKTNLAFPGWSSHTRCAADLSPLFLRTKTENVFRKSVLETVITMNSLNKAM